MFRQLRLGPGSTVAARPGRNLERGLCRRAELVAAVAAASPAGIGTQPSFGSLAGVAGDRRQGRSVYFLARGSGDIRSRTGPRTERAGQVRLSNARLFDARFVFA